VIVHRLSLSDFRSYAAVTIEFDDGLTVVTGTNGQGKTNLVEALAWLATLDSFRGAPPDALVRSGAEAAVLRADIVQGDGREILLEAELPRTGRHRVQVNRQRLARARDLVGLVQVSVFSPDDLALVKGGPGERRRFLDTTLVMLQRKNDALRGDLERILRQRNTLLRQATGRLTAEIAITLDVWDAKLAAVGEALGAARAELVAELEPLVGKAYADVAGESADVRLTYDPAWRSAGLAAALAAGRREDVRRQTTLVGPHRDDLDIVLNDLSGRFHASQGEQRTLALALRLAAHNAITARLGSAPLLLLDDVFSELDADRAAALLAHLPRGQVVITTAGGVPVGAMVARRMNVRDGQVFDG
jgi:DNA replication and repair protein RecF